MWEWGWLGLRIRVVWFENGGNELIGEGEWTGLRMRMGRDGSVGFVVR